MDRRELFGRIRALARTRAGSRAGGDHPPRRTPSPAQRRRTPTSAASTSPRTTRSSSSSPSTTAPPTATRRRCSSACCSTRPSKNAKLLGVEYIVSDARVPQAAGRRRRSTGTRTPTRCSAGGLIAPGMTAEDEMKFMKMILTTWGKTWHTWPDPKTPVPIGEPLLIWSLDRRRPGRREGGRRARQGIQAFDTAKIREARGQGDRLRCRSVPFPKSMDTRRPAVDRRRRRQADAAEVAATNHRITEGGNTEPTSER